MEPGPLPAGRLADVNVHDETVPVSDGRRRRLTTAALKATMLRSMELGRRSRTTQQTGAGDA